MYTLVDNDLSWKLLPPQVLYEGASGNSSGSTPTTPAGIFGVFKAHRNPDFLEKLREANIRAVFVPASCTGKLQPLDAVGGINDLLKRDLQQCFISHYADCFAKERKTGHDIKDVKVDLKLSMLKPPPPPCQLSAWGLRQNKQQLSGYQEGMGASRHHGGGREGPGRNKLTKAAIFLLSDIEHLSVNVS
ncbi:Hypp647 [Branchiostoma lanceolatum]|uniref:Hypp647 protein n=1 Tax=Branchiostoma lanceolatum TaxID=7740 RepID=A0A8J9VN99_BRALA|nr:Hypp647 [Branchiostoma lanceolatum]